MPGVFYEGVGEEGAPAELCGVGRVGEGFDGSVEEGGEGAEAGLAVLVLREVVVGLEALEPDAALQGVLADGVVDVVVEGVEVAGDAIVGADVGAGSGDGGRAVRGGGARDDECIAGNAGTDAGCERLLGGGNVAVEVEVGAGEADAGDVEEVRREDVLFLDA